MLLLELLLWLEAIHYYGEQSESRGDDCALPENVDMFAPFNAVKIQNVSNTGLNSFEILQISGSLVLPDLILFLAGFAFELLLLVLSAANLI